VLYASKWPKERFDVVIRQSLFSGPNPDLKFLLYTHTSQVVI